MFPILKSCVNIALGFISPENASECIKLINEIRVLPNNHKAKQVKLEVILLLAIISMILRLVYSCQIQVCASIILSRKKVSIPMSEGR